jgi:hypothetical protein
MPEATAELDDLVARLAAPFDPSEVRWKPQAINGNRALAIAYVDARVIQDRLDEVVGVCGWQDEYEVLPDGAVVCRLQIRLGGEWIVKEDVGGPSEQPDEGDRRKAAFSDSLKRAAVKFGVSRYLYRLPAQWVDYDQLKRQFKTRPTLPPQALPARKPGTMSTPAKTDRSTKDPPRDGTEMEERLKAADEWAVKGGYYPKGELTKHIIDFVRQKTSVTTPVISWPQVAIQAAWGELMRIRAEKTRKQPA